MRTHLGFLQNQVGLRGDGEILDEVFGDSVVEMLVHGVTDNTVHLPKRVACSKATKTALRS